MIDLTIGSYPRANECKGLIFRGKVNYYLNKNNEYVYQERMVLLKRKSCSGCKDCCWVFDDLKESILCDSIPIITNIENGALYKLTVVNESKDWETGMVDDYDFEFIKIKGE